MSRRILFLADVNSAHTRRWIEALQDNGLEIVLYSFSPPHDQWHSNRNIGLFQPKSTNPVTQTTSFSKVQYLSFLPYLRKVIRECSPDILHAHYCTSYGLLAVLTGHPRTIVSAWGSDVFDFPKRSFLYRWILSFVFARAKKLCSTSICMKAEMGKYTRKDITVIPFGIDLKVFQPSYFPGYKDTIVIGNIKMMELEYGNELLIDAFLQLFREKKRTNLRLLLVGSGSLLDSLRSKVQVSGLSEYVDMPGKIPHDQIHLVHKKIDIFVSPTLVDESFGVSLLESMASGKAIISTDTPGTREIVASPSIGMIIRRNSVEAIVQAIENLIDNPDSLRSIGENARIHVEKHYSWHQNVKQMISFYSTLLIPNNSSGS